jgi:hypothetical protein
MHADVILIRFIAISKQQFPAGTGENVLVLQIKLAIKISFFTLTHRIVLGLSIS